ncbi:DJ-1/PfpI family protein [Chitinophaga sedimenti]|nr:DJ-1/PfpI family protein [Chitinophaga sedimenti]MCK7554135.1 DJ-1/PfpI family protein [Chitinophaga sedimenti]
MAGSPNGDVRTRKVAILAADGVDESALSAIKNALTSAGAVPEVIAPRLGVIQGAGGADVPVDKSLLTVASVLYDAVYVPGGEVSVATIAADADAVHFLNEAFRHCKAIAFDAAAQPVLEATYFAKKVLTKPDAEGVQQDMGVVLDKQPQKLAKRFIAAIGMHRFWEREVQGDIPA